MKKTISLVATIILVASGIGTSVPNQKNKVINQKTKIASYKALSKGTIA